MEERHVLILGAGVTGLAAGYASGAPVFEALDGPGGICSSYYMRPGTDIRLGSAPSDGEAYRFEIGGGHWIFGGDPMVLRLVKSLAPTASYVRRSAVYFPDREMYVPYPIQNHLRFLGQRTAARVLEEIAIGPKPHVDSKTTMAEWLRQSFGPTLCDLFFDPFHELYTAGLFRQIAPQDAYKSPVDLSLAIQGAFEDVPPVGYNVSFLYPRDGLNVLTQRMAEGCRIQFGKQVIKIDTESREVYFSDRSSQKYDELIATLPLNRLIEMAGIDVGEPPDPATSVLVVNIGARKGPKCPSDHWLYIPKSQNGFHRVGFYSNVDVSFLPLSARERRDRVSVYVEKAYPEGAKPSASDLNSLSQAIAAELQEWGWIGDIEVLDPTWIDVAYTWSRPGSNWRRAALAALTDRHIYPVGRYARWQFQGIAESIRDGLAAGAAI